MLLLLPQEIDDQVREVLKIWAARPRGKPQAFFFLASATSSVTLLGTVSVHLFTNIAILRSP